MFAFPVCFQCSLRNLEFSRKKSFCSNEKSEEFYIYGISVTHTKYSTFTHLPKTDYFFLKVTMLTMKHKIIHD